MAERRRPQGYRGENHETIGSDVLSVLKVVTFPDTALGPKLAEELSRVKPNAWYPIAPLLDAMERLDQKLGRTGLVQMGRNIFRMSHRERVQQTAKSAADILYGLDAMYHHANRGRDIGGWRVTVFRPGYARMEKTTPHHCVVEEGILVEALDCVGVPAIVSQVQCLRSGSPLCEYELSSVITDETWTGGRASTPAPA